MKMSQPHYLRLKRSITDMPANANMRERWDAMWRAVDARRLTYEFLKLYNDDHIDTALRRINKEQTT